MSYLFIYLFIFTSTQLTIGLTFALILTVNRIKQHMCDQLVGLNPFFLMTMQTAAQEMQALSIPVRDRETPEVINSS